MKGDKRLVDNKDYRRSSPARRATTSPSTAPGSRRTPLEDRLAAAGNGNRASWPDGIAHLDSPTETEVEQDPDRLIQFVIEDRPECSATAATPRACPR
jgi:hypothetical protein